MFIGPIFDQDGQLLYFFASQMDITERRQTQDSYLQAQKMEAISQLTAGMAHDFNNLLQVINGNLEVALISQEKPDMARGALERAQRAAMRAGRLTHQLLTFARKQRLEPKPVNINILVVEFPKCSCARSARRSTCASTCVPGCRPAISTRYTWKWRC